MMVFIRKKFRKGNIYYYIGTIKTLIKKLKIADEVLKQKKN